MRRALELSPDATILDYVETELLSGSNLTRLTRQLRRALGFDELTRETVSRLVFTSGRDAGVSVEEAELRLKRARRAGAHALVEEAEALLDEADEDREAIAKAKAQADIRTWQAARYDRDTFGDAKGTNVTINLGAQLLEGLQQARSRVLSPSTSAPTELLPAQVVEVEEVS